MHPIRGETYLHKGKVYRVDLVSRATDEVVLEDITDGAVWEVRYALFVVAFERVWRVGEVAQFIGRSPRSISRYERAGLIDKPKRVMTKAGKAVRFYTKDDVMKIHAAVSEIHQGRPRKDGRVSNNSMPHKAELVAMFRERFGL